MTEWLLYLILLPVAFAVTMFVVHMRPIWHQRKLAQLASDIRELEISMGIGDHQVLKSLDVIESVYPQIGEYERARIVKYPEPKPRKSNYSVDPKLFHGNRTWRL